MFIIQVRNVKYYESVFYFEVVYRSSFFSFEVIETNFCSPRFVVYGIQDSWEINLRETCFSFLMSEGPTYRTNLVVF